MVGRCRGSDAIGRSPVDHVAPSLSVLPPWRTPASYDEFGLFRENAEEFGIVWHGPPTVRRESVAVAVDGRVG